MKTSACKLCGKEINKKWWQLKRPTCRRCLQRILLSRGKKVKPKAKRCKVCNSEFMPFNTMAVACSAKCALEIGRKQLAKKHEEQAKNQRKKDREKKKELQPKRIVLRDAQIAFNAYIRYRDKDQLCINTHKPVSFDGNDSDAAHFYSRGSHPALRFDLRNVHKSTKASNAHQEKYIHDYRKNLIDRLGKERFERFEQDAVYWRTHKRTFNKEYLERVKKIFRKKKRVLMKIRGDA